MDIDLTDQSTSDQTVQSQEESSCVPHTQRVTRVTMSTVDDIGALSIGVHNTIIINNNNNFYLPPPPHSTCYNEYSRLVKRIGGLSIGAHNKIIINNNNFYLPPPPHSTCYNEYSRLVEQAEISLEPDPSFPGQSTCPVPQRSVSIPLQDQVSGDEDTAKRDTSGQSQTDRKTVLPSHCQEGVNYHLNNHPPLDKQQHRPHRDPLPSPQQTENEETTREREKMKDSEKKENPTSGTKSQEMGNYSRDVSCERKLSRRGMTNKTQPTKAYQENVIQRSSLSTQPSDVTPTVTRADQGERKQATASNTADTQRKENIKSRGVPRTDETIPGNNSKGWSLKPADPVLFYRDGRLKRGICIKSEELEVVSFDSRQGGPVEKFKLDVPFVKLRVASGRCRVFSPEEIIERAERRVGSGFTEGVWLCNGWDFICWVFTGKPGILSKFRGFKLKKDFRAC